MKDLHERNYDGTFKLLETFMSHFLLWKVFLRFITNSCDEKIHTKCN